MIPPIHHLITHHLITHQVVAHHTVRHGFHVTHGEVHDAEVFIVGGVGKDILDDVYKAVKRGLRRLATGE